MGFNYDFSGWATKNDLLCSDGRTIRRDAFKDNDGGKVPLIWNHNHTSLDNVIGHALLENREDGVYAYCSLNDTDLADTARRLIRHGDITNLSIYANKLKQKGSDVLHGVIREVSLVMAGANPGAHIDSVMIHGELSDEEAIIYTDEEISLEHTATLADVPPEEEVEEKPVKKETPAPKKPKKEAPKAEESAEDLEHADEEDAEEDEETEKPAKKGKTVGEVIDSMDADQQKVMYTLIGLAKGGADEDSDESEEDNEGDSKMKHNVFDSDSENRSDVLSHSDMEAIIADATRGSGTTLKEAAISHGIEDIDILFPDAKNVTPTPEWIKRDTGWVADVMNSTHHSPFSRIKSIFANITADEARARGYMKGNRKEDEVFTLLKRTTDPQTVYKKQSFDRDDVIDITDFDVVAWTKGEMRGMLDEELARAFLVGDGRSSASNDKIKEDHIRPIWTDDDLFTIKYPVTVTAGATDTEIAKAFIRGAKRSRKDYKGSGNPVLYTTEDVLTSCLLIEDLNGRVIYDTEEKLRTALRVNRIVTVPVMENLTRVVGVDTHFLMGLIVNLNDYNVGADKGGAVSMFDNFDIDFNKQKYLIETRCSGALTKPFSAIALELVYGSFILDGAPIAGTTTILGKTVSDLQDGIVMTNSGITGTAKYVTGFTGFSGDPAEQKGNFLALHFTAPAGATTTCQMLGGRHPDRIVTLDEDMDLVIRIDDKRKNKLKIVSTTTGGDKLEKIYDLSMLTLETE